MRHHYRFLRRVVTHGIPAGVLSAVLFGCGGASSDSSSTAPASPQPKEYSGTTTAGTGASSVVLATGTSVSLPAGAVASGATVTLSESVPPGDAVDDSTRTLSIHISGVASGAATALPLSVTWMVPPAPAGEQYMPTYRLASDTLVRFAQLDSNSSNDAASIGATRSTAPAFTALPLTVFVAASPGGVIDLTLVMSMELHVAETEASCASVFRLTPAPNVSVNPNATGAVVLIHGLQINRACTPTPPLQSFDDFDPSATWAAMVRAIVAARPDLNIYEYRYPTTLDPTVSGKHLLPMVEGIGPSGPRKIVLVAHSMGGLVARAFDALDQHGRLAGIVTLGTPHHGALLAGTPAADLVLGSPGVQSLVPNAFDRLTPLPTHASLYAIRGGVPCDNASSGAPTTSLVDAIIVSIVTTSECAAEGSLAPDIGFSDGIVENTSALPEGVEAKFYDASDFASNPRIIVTHFDLPANPRAIAATVAELGVLLPTPPAVASVYVTPSNPSVAVGSSLQLTATVVAVNNSDLSGRTVDWSSDQPQIAAVAANGMVTGVATGTATITATDVASGVRGSTVVSVTPVGSGEWATVAPMPTPRRALGVAVVNGILYAIGGMGSANQPLGTVEAYDPATNTWTTMAPMPTPRESFGVAVVDGLIYAVGGNDGTNYYSTVEVFDPATNTWSAKSPMGVVRSDLGVGVANGIIYAVGGHGTGFSVLSAVEAFDPTTDAWTDRSPMPAPRQQVGVATIGGSLYVAGGANPASTRLATLTKYNPATDTWTTLASMPTARGAVGVDTANGSLYVVGGETSAHVYTAALEAYDPGTNSWFTLTAMPTARYYIGAAFVDGTLYVAGGMNTALPSALAVVEAIRPPKAGQ